MWIREASEVTLSPITILKKILYKMRIFRHNSIRNEWMNEVKVTFASEMKKTRQAKLNIHIGSRKKKPNWIVYQDRNKNKYNESKLKVVYCKIWTESWKKEIVRTAFMLCSSSKVLPNSCGVKRFPIPLNVKISNPFKKFF